MSSFVCSEVTIHNIAAQTVLLEDRASSVYETNFTVEITKKYGDSEAGRPIAIPLTTGVLRTRQTSPTTSDKKLQQSLLKIT